MVSACDGFSAAGVNQPPSMLQREASPTAPDPPPTRSGVLPALQLCVQRGFKVTGLYTLGDIGGAFEAGVSELRQWSG